MASQNDMDFQVWASDKTFMVVESLGSLRMMVAGLLHGLGTRKVMTATSGKDALAKLAASERAPDIILCDSAMPDMDSLGLLDQVKQAYPTAKMVFLTSANHNDDLGLARRHGIDGCIAMPFSRDSLLMALKRLQAA